MQNPFLVNIPSRPRRRNAWTPLPTDYPIRVILARFGCHHDVLKAVPSIQDQVFDVSDGAVDKYPY